MKKTRTIFALFSVLLVALLSACVAPLPEGEKSVVIKVGGESYQITTDYSCVGEVIDMLVEEEGLHLSATGSASDQYGRWINELGTLIPSGSNQSIMLYTSVNDIRYSSDLFTHVEGSITYYQTNYSFDLMPLFDGATYIFVIDTF